MIESKDIKNMVQHILRRDKGIADTNMMHPSREWFTGLAITCIIVLLGSWLCLYLYTFYTNELKKEVVIIEQAVPYQAATVKSALEVFAAKEQTYNNILGGRDVGTVQPMATTTPQEVIASSSEPIPELIRDPAPVVEDVDMPPATLAP
jgi:hypothetical protein